MAKLTLIVESTTDGNVAGGGGITIEKTIIDGSWDRILAAYEYIYVNSGDIPNPSPTRTRVTREWFQQFIRGSRATARNTEVEIAVNAAKTGVPDVTE